VIAWVLGVAVAASFAYSVWLTATTPTVAYFSTFTRAWEFGAGALLALVAVEAGRRATAVVPVIGVAMIVLACVLFTAETPFPGAAAALPVIGAIAVLWAGRHSIVARVGAFAPVALLGHISYAVYLWHWPLIVMVPYVTGRPLGTVDKVLILIATLLLAWASTRFVEEPVRFSPRLLGGRRRAVTVGAWSLVGMAIVVAVSATNLVALQQRDDARAAVIASVKSDTPECLGAQSMDRALRTCLNPVLDGVLVPDPAVAKTDDDNLPECWGMAGPGRAKICTVAAPEGYTRHLLAVGDSHNNTLIGAYRAIGEAHGWRIDVAGMPGCYLTTAAQDHVSDQQRRACEAWRASVVEATWNTPIDALIVTHSTGDNIVLPGPGQTVESATVDGLVEAWRSVPPVPIIAIRDNPGMTRETAECVSRHALDAAEACARPRAEALVFDGQAEAAQAVPSARVVDLTPFYCTETACPPVIGNVLVYRDSRHVTSTWTRTLAPYLDRAIMEQLGW
jgi:hypothetical protein